MTFTWLSTGDNLSSNALHKSEKSLLLDNGPLEVQYWPVLLSSADFFINFMIKGNNIQGPVSSGTIYESNHGTVEALDTSSLRLYVNTNSTYNTVKRLSI